MDQSKLTGVGTSSRVSFEQGINIFFLMPEAGQKRQVHILCQSWLPPTLNCHPANETERPVVLLTESLDIFCGGKAPSQMDHVRRPLWKIACCSTSPDQSGRSRHPSTAPSL